MGDGSIIVNTGEAEQGAVFLVLAHCEYLFDALEELEGSLFEPWLLMMPTLCLNRCMYMTVART